MIIGLIAVWLSISIGFWVEIMKEEWEEIEREGKYPYSFLEMFSYFLVVLIIGPILIPIVILEESKE